MANKITLDKNEIAINFGTSANIIMTTDAAIDLVKKILNDKELTPDISEDELTEEEIKAFDQFLNDYRDELSLDPVYRQEEDSRLRNILKDIVNRPNTPEPSEPKTKIYIQRFDLDRALDYEDMKRGIHYEVLHSTNTTSEMFDAVKFAQSFRTISEDKIISIVNTWEKYKNSTQIYVSRKPGSVWTREDEPFYYKAEDGKMYVFIRK